MRQKLIVWALLLSVLLGVFGGCTPADTDTDDPANGVPENFFPIVSEGVSEYKIVYPSGNTTAQVLAQALVSYFDSRASVKLEIAEDSKPGESEYEIRLGRVGRMDALALDGEFSSFGTFDYAIRVVGKAIYLYARYDQGLSMAVDYFCQKISYSNAAKRLVAIPSDCNVVYIKSAVQPATLTGSDSKYVSFSLGMGTTAETFCRISFTGNHAWRIQTKTNATEPFDDNGGAAQRLSLFLGETPPSSVEDISVVTDGGTTTATASDGSRAVLHTDTFRLEFYNANGELSSSISDIFTTKGGSRIEGELLPDEAIFGTGERFNTVNQRGKTLELVSKDLWSKSTACYAAIPLLCLSRGAGIFLNRYEAMTVDLGDKQANVWTADIQNANLDCYIMTTESISDVLYTYSTLTGFAAQPEEWSYGMFVCRFQPDNSQKWAVDVTWDEDRFGPMYDENGNKLETVDGRGYGVYEFIAKMEAYDLPWDGFILENWGAYKTEKHDDLKEICDYVHSLGKKVMVYISVGNPGTTMPDYLTSYLLSQTLPDGSINDKLPDVQDVYNLNPDSSEGIKRYYLDITNPNAVEWFFDECWDYLSNEIGVDGCKIDFCELMPENYELNYYDESMPTEGSHHWYPTAFCAKFWEMLSKKPDSGMCYIRGGGIGLQRSPYVWLGDQRREYVSLSYQLAGALSAGLSGIPFVSYDMSGYEYTSRAAYGSGWETQPTRKLAYESGVFLRGLQFTAFTMCMQTHGTVRMAYEFSEEGDHVWVKNADGSYSKQTDESGNYVWAPLTKNGQQVLDEHGNPVYVTPGTYSYVTDVYRAYVKLHELLVPYIAEYSEIACKTAVPIMRHLVLYDPDDANVYNINDEYMFGDAFLVAPVLDDTTSRKIYLPKGEWKDLNTGEIISVTGEGQTLTYDASIVTLPVFYNMNTTSKTSGDLLLGIEEIFTYLGEIDEGIPSYLK